MDNVTFTGWPWSNSLTRDFGIGLETFSLPFNTSPGAEWRFSDLFEKLTPQGNSNSSVRMLYYLDRTGGMDQLGKYKGGSTNNLSFELREGYLLVIGQQMSDVTFDTQP